jgi:hypothetical protein
MQIGRRSLLQWAIKFGKLSGGESSLKILQQRSGR